MRSMPRLSGSSLVLWEFLFRCLATLGMLRTAF